MPLGLALALVSLGSPAHGQAGSGGAQPAAFVRCLGWGLCEFRRLEGAPPGGAAADSAAGAMGGAARVHGSVAVGVAGGVGDAVRVRLRGVGDPGLSGLCTPEREAAQTIRHFVEGILGRAGRLDLTDPVARSDGTWLAGVRVDGTDLNEILIHIGLGREKPLDPKASWCD